MRPKTLYGILCFGAVLLRFYQIVHSIRQFGLDGLLPVWSFSAHDGLSGAEVLIGLIALWVLIIIEGNRSRMGNLWIPVAASLLIGVFFGLPLFLYLREARLQASMWSGGRCEV